MMKTGKNNRFLASILAASMMLAMSPFAFAADTAEQKEMTTQEQVQSATQNETNANLAMSQMDGQPSEDTHSEAPKTEGQSSEDTNSEKGQPSENVKPTGEDTTAGGGTSAPESPAESENPTESETPAEPEAPKNAAKIGGTEYASIADAIAAAQPDDTIELLRDVTENITIGKSLTLDLAGFTLSGEDEEENAVVTITGSDETKPEITIKSSKLEEEKPVNGTITGGKNPDNGGGLAIDNATVTLENLVITGNEAVGSGGGTQGGGGIYAANAAVTMQNVTVSDNTVTGAINDGGGLLVKDGTLTMTGCTVENNTAPDQGGGMVIPNSVLKIDSSVIKNNHSKHGAGIFLDDTVKNEQITHAITDTTIEENTADELGGGIYVGTTSTVIIKDSTLRKNSAASQGGAIVAYSADTIELDHVSITENTSESGGGILSLCTAVCETNIVLKNGTKVDKNVATGYFGGGIYAYAMGNHLNVSVADSSISGNTAQNGAGIFTYGVNDATINVNLQSNAQMHNNNATNGSGGAIYAYDKSAHINVAEGSALYNNTATKQGDDLWMNGATFTLPKASAMSGDKQFKVSEEETKTVTGWFYDGWYKWDPNAASASGEAETKGAYVEAARWSMDQADEYTPVENDTSSIALKAAAKKAPSGGGGGGSHKPTVTIPDDVPTGLNGDDHYAYIVGYPDSTVRPQNGITRAEVATIFFRLLTDETRNANSTKTNSYSDVAAGAWYNHAVSTLSAMGIVKGDSNGKFNPNAPITRAEFAAIAARFDDKANTTAVDFSDIASHWAKNEISAAANNGWINGYTDGTFRPNNKITRAEAMTLVNRVLKRLPETAEDLHNDMIKWSDNSDTSAWYYLAVQEATNSHYYDLKENKHEKWSKLRETRDWTELEK